jgi:plasmid stabilization system protein ParE
MTLLVVSPQANADFSNILERLRELAGQSVAERYARDLRAVYQRLTIFPEIGSPRRKLGGATRIVVLRPYLVVYDYFRRDDFVNVVRIVDGRRNVNRRLVRG